MRRSTVRTDNPKCSRGPGGIHCSCCRPLPSVTESRRFINRVTRHKDKANDKAELKRLQTEVDDMEEDAKFGEMMTIISFGTLDNYSGE
jgi:hypothetical protein